MRICLPELLWYGNTTTEIDLPDDWNVEIFPMNGAEVAPLTIAQMDAAINAPIGTSRISELAKGKKRAVIIFDDMTRPTRTFELAPLVIKELKAGGIVDENITFVCALGTHGELTANEFRKKVGPELLAKYRVFNHNIYENCVEIGTTSRGTKMMINREVAEADLKIAIGCVTAHAQVGFSGGGKLVLPGISHVDSITHYHLEVDAMDHDSTGMGKYPDNILQMEIEEAGQMAGIDFVVNIMVNGRGNTTHVFAGDLKQVYHEAVKLAADHYATTPSPQNKQLAISNAFVKANEMAIAAGLGMMSLKDYAGTVVVIANSPEGQVVHKLVGRWGTTYGGRQYPVTAIPPGVKLIIQAPFLERTFADWFSDPEEVTFTRNWEETMELIGPNFGAGTEVAVIPTGTMQYFKR